MINFEFIAGLEGKCLLEGYVPDPDGSKSGVTIATGFDLGCRSEKDLKNLGLAPDIIEKLKPYLGLKKHDAVAALAAKKLRLKPEQSRAIDAISHKTSADDIERAYNKASKVKFADLPDNVQTVISSVAFQYGNLAVKCPVFWKQCIVQDYAGMRNNLNDFGDAYPTRRKKEAALLKDL